MSDPILPDHLPNQGLHPIPNPIGCSNPCNNCDPAVHDEYNVVLNSDSAITVYAYKPYIDAPCTWYQDPSGGGSGVALNYVEGKIWQLSFPGEPGWLIFTQTSSVDPCDPSGCYSDDVGNYAQVGIDITTNDCVAVPCTCQGDMPGTILLKAGTIMSASFFSNQDCTGDQIFPPVIHIVISDAILSSLGPCSWGNNNISYSTNGGPPGEGPFSVQIQGNNPCVWSLAGPLYTLIKSTGLLPSGNYTGTGCGFGMKIDGSGVIESL